MFGSLKSCLGEEHARPPSTAVPPPRGDEPLLRTRMIDVEGMLRQASTRVSVDQLVRKGKRHVHLLSRDKIAELINRAVATMVDKHRVTAALNTAASAAQIEADSRAEFEELLQQYQQTAAATSAVETSKQALEADFEEARFEPDLEEAAKAARPSGNGRAEPSGSFEDFVRELDKHVARMFAIRTLILGRSGSPEAVEELHRVEEIIRTLLAKLVDLQRGRFSAPAGDAREVSTLRKRTEKLLAHIATMEAALKTLSTAKSFSNQQVQNLLRDLGLADEDKNFEKKKEMLKVVLGANQGIRKMARELAERGITLDAPEEKAVFTRVDDPVSGVFERSSV